MNTGQLNEQNTWHISCTELILPYFGPTADSMAGKIKRTAELTDCVKVAPLREL